VTESYFWVGWNSLPSPALAQMSAAATPAPALRKIAGKQGCGRRLSHSETQTSAQELALAKSLKHSSKFAAKSSSISTAERASVASVKVVGKKMSSTCAGGSVAAHALTRVLNLFDSASDNKNAPSEPPRKRLSKSPLAKGVRKPSMTKGNLG
jgi:hypothetical protein